MQTGCSPQAREPALSESAPQPRVVRLRGVAIAVPCWTVLVVAACLTPAKGGYGTHERMGLPPCSFVANTGLPCPTCGMTTAITAMVHGHVIVALKAHVFGVVLFVVAVVLAVVGTIEAVRGRDVLSHLRPGVWWVWTALAGLLVGWGVKLAVGYADGTLPIR